MKVVSSLAVLAASASLVLLSGCNNPGTGQNTWSIQGVDGPHLEYQPNQMVIYATFDQIQIDAGATVKIPDMPNSTIEVAPDMKTGGLLLQANISAKDVADLVNLNILNPQALPDGRPLPGVAGGMLPALAVQVPSLDNVTFYVGPQVFGLFVPFKIKIDQAIGTFAYYDDSGKHLGNISIVGMDAQKQGSGFLLLINLNSAVSVMANQGLLRLN